jgi:hypothetical protein
VGPHFAGKVQQADIGSGACLIIAIRQASIGAGLIFGQFPVRHSTLGCGIIRWHKRPIPGSLRGGPGSLDFARKFTAIRNKTLLSILGFNLTRLSHV